MKVPVYLIRHPDFPGRVFVSGWAPTPERAASLRAEGAEIFVIEANLPDEVQCNQAMHSAAEPRKYLGRRVRRPLPLPSTHVLYGTIEQETETAVVVHWDYHTARGTFFRDEFERALQKGTLDFVEEQAATQEQGQHGKAEEQSRPRHITLAEAEAIAEFHKEVDEADKSRGAGDDEAWIQGQR